MSATIDLNTLNHPQLSAAKDRENTLSGPYKKNSYIFHASLLKAVLFKKFHLLDGKRSEEKLNVTENP